MAEDAEKKNVSFIWKIKQCLLYNKLLSVGKQVIIINYDG